MTTATEGGPTLLLCDVWDQVWCRTLTAGAQRIAERLVPVIKQFRSAGGQIIHAPSETMGFYQGHPARQWVVALSRVAVPTEIDHPDPALPPPPGPKCSDDPPCTPGPPWPHTRENDVIEIEPEDAILDSGDDLLAVYHARQLGHIYIAGVHTNACILKRPFAIKQMVRWGIPCTLVRDYTEAEPPPYTEAVIDYIEKNWCPTILGAEMLAGI